MYMVFIIVGLIVSCADRLNLQFVIDDQEMLLKRLRMFRFTPLKISLICFVLDKGMAEAVYVYIIIRREGLFMENTLRIRV